MTDQARPTIDWTTPLDRYRQGPEGPQGPAGWAAAQVALVACGLALLHRQFRKYLEILGRETAEDAVRRKMLEPDGRGHTLCHYLAEPTVQLPAAFAYTALSRALCDAARKLQRERSRTARAPDNEGALDRAAGSILADTAGDPRRIPNEVLAVLNLVAHGLPVALQLMASQRLPADHPLAKGQNRLKLRQFAVEIFELTTFLHRDVELQHDRLRWQHGDCPARDAWVRAWLARFYVYETLTAYAASSEVPASHAASRAAFDQHNRRFRQRWQAAVGEGLPVTKRHGDKILAVAARRLPVPQHPTLGPPTLDQEEP